MMGLMLLAAAAGGGNASAGALAAWRRCLGDTARVSAQAGRLPEEMPALLSEACPDQRARYAAALGRPDPAAVKAQGDALIGNYVRRYAIFYTTGLWPTR